MITPGAFYKMGPVDAKPLSAVDISETQRLSANVKTDNTAALAVYQSLGLAIIASFESYIAAG